MNIINYDLIRILSTIIFGLIILSILLIIKKICPKVLKKEQHFIVIVIIVLYFIYNMYSSYAAVIFKFNSVDQASKFFYPSKKVIKKYEFNDYAYFIYGNNGLHNIVYYKKVNSKWKIGNYKKGKLKHSTIKKYRSTFRLYNTPNNETIIISNFYIHNKDDQIKIAKSMTDSFNSKFDTHLYNCNRKYCYVLQNTFIKEKLKEDYTINIGKNKIELFR